MKNKIFLTFLFIFIYVHLSYSQCILNSFNANGIDVLNIDTIEICYGDSVMLTATGVCGYLMNNNFNNGTIGNGWQSNASPMFNNPCGAGNGTIYLWIGDASSFPRDLITIPFDVSGAGCTICFDLRFAVQGANTPCEGPDEVDEGVSLQYSVNNGPWRDIVYFRPDGNQYPNNQWIGQGTSVGSGNTSLTTWSNYCFTVPNAARSTQTRFRWHQEQVTDYDYDHWGLDNVSISCPASQNIIWSNNVIGDTNILHPPIGVTTIGLALQDTIGSNIAYDTIVIITHQVPTSTFTADDHLCQDENMTITYTGNATPNATYLWDFAGANIVSGSNMGPFVVNWTDAAIHDVSLQVSEQNCNSPVTRLPITVSPRPVVDFIALPLNGCNPLLVTFTDHSSPSPIVWSWNFGNPGSAYNTSDAQNPSHTYANQGEYTVILTVTTSEGCTDSLKKTNYIDVYQTPKADFSVFPSKTTTDEPTIIFYDLSLFSSTWNWNFGDPQSGQFNTSSNSSPYHDYNNEGIYDITLTVYSEDGCTDETSRTVAIEQAYTLYLPTSFTPNGDGINDRFYPQGFGVNWEKGYSMKIFDRWGSLIFESNDYLKTWDGTVKDKPMPGGMYSWYLIVFDKKRARHEYNGTVNLLR